MELEESVKGERNNGNNKSDKERKIRVVKSIVDVIIVKDTKSFIDKVIEVRGLNKDTVKCRVVPDKGQGSLKIVVSLFDWDINPDISFTYQERKHEKLTGSNCLLVLAKINVGQER